MSKNLPKRVGEDTPAWLVKKAEEDTSLDTLKQYRRLPILRLMQALTPDELKEPFGEGSCVMMPQKLKVCDKAGGFNFIPLAPYTEYINWSDRKDLSAPAVFDSSRDPNSEIALKSKSREERSYAYGNKDQYKGSYAEHINFLGVLIADDGSYEPCGLSFSKGEFFNGMTWSGELVDIGAPIWSGIWAFTISKHKNKVDQKWWGFDMEFNKFISEEQSEELEALSIELRAGIKAQEVGVDIEAATDKKGAPKADPEFAG